jgi:outer membrane protein assembly factor BamD (BamD/ComL family)
LALLHRVEQTHRGTRVGVEALGHLYSMYWYLGDDERASRICKVIIRDYPESSWAPVARDSLRVLTDRRAKYPAGRPRVDNASPSASPR